MKRKSAVPIAALALLAVGILSVPAITQAHKVTYANTVTAAAKNKNQVEGKVSSSKAKCLPQRLVGVYSPTGALEATGSTDAQGGFRINDKNLAAGTHYVKVRKRVLLKNRHHRHTCGAAKTSFVAS